MTNRSRVQYRFLPLLLLACSGLQAESGDATLAAEATVYEEQSGENAGGDSEVCIGNHATTDTRRAFVRYTLPAIPATATVERVVLQLQQDRVRSQGSGAPKTATLLVRRVTASWTEGTGSGGGSGPCGGGANVAGVDWASQPAIAAVSGASAALSANDNVSVVLDTDIGTSADGLIADVQSWVADNATNFGWRLAVSEEATADNARALVPGTLTVHWSNPDIVFENGFESLP